MGNDASGLHIVQAALDTRDDFQFASLALKRLSAGQKTKSLTASGLRVNCCSRRTCWIDSWPAVFFEQEGTRHDNVASAVAIEELPGLLV